MKKLNIGAGNLIIEGYENHDKIKQFELIIKHDEACLINYSLQRF